MKNGERKSNKSPKISENGGSSCIDQYQAHHCKVNYSVECTWLCNKSKPFLRFFWHSLRHFFNLSRSRPSQLRSSGFHRLRTILRMLLPLAMFISSHIWYLRDASKHDFIENFLNFTLNELANLTRPHTICCRSQLLSLNSIPFVLTYFCSPYYI